MSRITCCARCYAPIDRERGVLDGGDLYHESCWESLTAKDRERGLNITASLRGAAALHEMLNLIGTSAEEGGDAKLAKIFVDNEESIGALLTYAIENLAGET